REDELPLGTRSVKALAGSRRTVAEPRVPRPQVDAGRARLVRIVLARHRRPLRPPPRPHGAEVHLLRDIARGQNLPLHGLEPRLRSEPLSSPGAFRRLEADEDAELRDRNADPREVQDPVPKRLAQCAVAEDGPL